LLYDNGFTRGFAPRAKADSLHLMAAHQMNEMNDATIKPDQDASKPAPMPMPKEIGGPRGPEPTRYGDWEVKGRCSDF
jgi:hypothetical protein